MALNDSTTLSRVEAVQLGALFEDCLESLQLLGDLTRDILDQRQELAAAAGDEIAQIIDEQRQLEQRYEELIEQRAQLRTLANKTKFKEVDAELQQVAARLRASTQILCRNLKENPNVAANLEKIQSERRNLQGLISTTITELGEVSFRTLLRTVDEDKNKEEELRNIIAKEKEATAAVKQLTKELETEERDRTEQLFELNTKIAKKKTNLQKAKTAAMDDYNSVKKRYTAEKYSRRRQWEETERALNEELKEINRRIEIEKRCSERTAGFLRRKDEALQVQLDAWLKKNEQDVAAKKQELARLDNKLKMCQQSIEQKTEQYREIQQLVEEDHKELKQLEAARLFGVKMGAAAGRIQRMFRAHRVRKKLLQLRNKKKRRKPAAE